MQHILLQSRLIGDEIIEPKSICEQITRIEPAYKVFQKLAQNIHK